MKFKTWPVLLIIAGLFALGCAAPSAGGPDSPEPAQVVTAQPTSSPAVPRQTVTVKGKNNSVGQIKATLNGAFTVDYTFGSWCGIAEFLKADGSEGAGAMETVNDCAASTSEKLKGSTIVHLKNVTQVKVQNTRGAWELTFTPIG